MSALYLSSSLIEDKEKEDGMWDSVTMRLSMLILRSTALMDWIVFDLVDETITGDADIVLKSAFLLHRI